LFQWIKALRAFGEGEADSMFTLTGFLFDTKQGYSFSGGIARQLTWQDTGSAKRSMNAAPVLKLNAVAEPVYREFGGKLLNKTAKAMLTE
jgi:hypothetical protein